jgi:hypothetical protein
MYEFFLNTSKGIAGAQLLAREIINILEKNLVNAYKETVIKHLVFILQNERFVKNGKVIQAYADLYLIELIKNGDIEKLIKNLNEPAEHDEFILNRLIEKKLVASFKSQWSIFVQVLKKNMSMIAEQTQLTKTDRTKFFISKLIDLLPVYLAEKFLSLDAEIFIACDNENENVFNEVQCNILQYIDEFECPVFEDEQIKNIIQSIRSVMVSRQHNNSVKLRCGAPCPCCKAPCHLDTEHIISIGEPSGQSVFELAKQIDCTLKRIRENKETQHDTHHQPAGLIDTYWREHSTQVNEIDASSCSMAVRDGVGFWYSDKRYKYRDFNKVFPEWSLPLYNNNHRLKLREYIFDHYHEELARHYGRLPCTRIPAEYKHDLNSIEKELLNLVDDT